MKREENDLIWVWESRRSIEIRDLGDWVTSWVEKERREPKRDDGVELVVVIVSDLGLDLNLREKSLISY